MKGTNAETKDGKGIEFWLKVLAALIAIVGVVYEYQNYKQRASLQALQSIHAARLSVCQTVSENAAKLFSVSDIPGFETIRVNFAEIKHGKALMLLDPEVVYRMVTVHNLAFKVTKYKSACKSLPQRAYCILEEKPFELVLACRDMINRDYTLEAGAPIKSFSAPIAMSWAQGTCSDECRTEVTKLEEAERAQALPPAKK